MDNIIGWVSMGLVAWGAWWLADHHPSIAIAAALWLGFFGFLMAFHCVQQIKKARSREQFKWEVSKVGFRDRKDH